MQEKVFIISGSPEYNLTFLKEIKEKYLLKAEVYAVDKGLEICDKLNIPITKIIGDFDSISPEILKKYPEEIKIKYPIDKDKSDTEISIDIALKNNFNNIVLLNTSGARMDHFLINTLLLLKNPQKIKIIESNGTLFAIEPGKSHKIELKSSILFSLIPLNKCKNVSLSGCKYPLKNKNLFPSSLTLSNIAEGPISISFEKGNLFFFAEDCLF